MKGQKMAIVLDGAEVAEALNKKVSAQVKELRALGIVPRLATLRVGGRGDDIAYERAVTRSAAELGAEVKNLVFPESLIQEELIHQLKNQSDDPGVQGILLFSPLPGHLDEKAVRAALAPEKDVDGITDLSRAAVFAGASEGFAPCTACACMEILNYYGVELAGRHAVVIGRSLVVGKPVAMMLLQRNATVTICHSHTQNLPAVVRSADLVIACVGQANMINGQYLSKGQTVIDVGINVCEDKTIVGDVDFKVACEKAAAITPVPGGVGAVTNTVLLKHLVQAATKA